MLELMDGAPVMMKDPFVASLKEPHLLMTDTIVL